MTYLHFCKCLAVDFEGDIANVFDDGVVYGIVTSEKDFLSDVVHVYHCPLYSTLHELDIWQFFQVTAKERLVPVSYTEAVKEISWINEKRNVWENYEIVQP